MSQKSYPMAATSLQRKITFLKTLALILNPRAEIKNPFLWKQVKKKCNLSLSLTLYPRPLSVETKLTPNHSHGHHPTTLPPPPRWPTGRALLSVDHFRHQPTETLSLCMRIKHSKGDDFVLTRPRSRVVFACENFPLPPEKKTMVLHVRTMFPFSSSSSAQIQCTRLFSSMTSVSQNIEINNPTSCHSGDNRWTQRLHSPPPIDLKQRNRPPSVAIL